jgi:hypothetical protein
MNLRRAMTSKKDLRRLPPASRDRAERVDERYAKTESERHRVAF